MADGKSKQHAGKNKKKPPSLFSRKKFRPFNRRAKADSQEFRQRDFTIREREDMFIYWCKANQNNTATARHFGVARGSIIKIGRVDKWPERFIETIEKIRTATEKDIVRSINKNIDQAQQIYDKIGAKLLAKGGAAIEPNIFGYVKVGRYIADAAGPEPVSQQREVIVRVVERVINASDTERKRLAGNLLAGSRDFADERVAQIAALLHGPVHTSN